MNARLEKACFTQSQQQEHLEGGKAKRSSRWILKAKICSNVVSTHYYLSPRKLSPQRRKRNSINKSKSILDERSEKRETVIEDFCNTEANTNA